MFRPLGPNTPRDEAKIPKSGAMKTAYFWYKRPKKGASIAQPLRGIRKKQNQFHKWRVEIYRLVYFLLKLVILQKMTWHPY